VVLVLSSACVGEAPVARDPVGLSVAVAQSYACASAVGRGTWCWGDDLPIRNPADREHDTELQALAAIDAIDLDVLAAPMVLDADGVVTRWGSAWTGELPRVVADDGIALHGGFVLRAGGDLVSQDAPLTTIAEDVEVFAGAPACWAGAGSSRWSCEDGFLREGPRPWVDLDRLFGNVCGVTDDGVFHCTEGALVGSSWNGDVVGFPEFPQRDGFPARPRFVQVEVDLDQHFCLRDEDGRIACRGGHVPDEVSGRTGWVDLDVGFGVACAIHADGDVACWGRSDFGLVPAP
jgi:hypothetical protein